MIADIAVETQKQVVTRLVSAADLKWFVASMAGVAVAVVGTIGWAQTAIDAGTQRAVASVGERVTRAEGNIARQGERMEAIERSAIRSEAMLEMVLKQRGIQPPPKTDGGP